MNPAELDPATLKVYQTIQNAMVQAAPKTVTFEYEAASGERTKREVEPYEIKGDQLFGHCLDREAIRRFKLSGMTDVAVGATFRPRHPIRIPL